MATEAIAPEELNRLKVGWIGYKPLLSLLNGEARLSGLPKDAVINSVFASPERRAFYVWFWSSEFPIVPDGHAIDWVDFDIVKTESK